MFNMIKDNIKSFLDVTVILTMIAIGIFVILSDYKYFKKMKYRKDASISLGVGLGCILLPFILLVVVRL